MPRRNNNHHYNVNSSLDSTLHNVHFKLLAVFNKLKLQKSKQPSKMITYHRKRFKGSKGQGPVQEVADLPGEILMSGSVKQTVVIGLQAASQVSRCKRSKRRVMAASQVSRGPQPKQSKGRVDPVKTGSSGVVAASQVSSDTQPKSSTGRVMAASQVSSGPQPKRSEGRVSARKQSPRPQQRKNRKRVAAESSDSEKTTAGVSRAHRFSRRRVKNGRQEGKLDDEVLSKYLGDLWQTIPSDKKDSCAYIECLWFAMYQKGDKEKALRWIRRERIFSKKYVFLPICLSKHWSLLILCNLGEDLQSKDTTPCVLLLDSLRNADPLQQHKKLIRKFLLDIYEVEGRSVNKKQIDKIPLLLPKVPQQTGDKECGYYVLYYITQFLMSCPETFSISNGYPNFMSEGWFTAAEVESFCKTLPSPDQETGLGNDLSDGGSDDVVFIE